MAIQFLNTVDLNQNQLNNVAIQNIATDPLTGVLGQIVFNTTLNHLRICVTASSTGPTVNAVYEEVGGGVDTFTNSSGTYVAYGTNNTNAVGDVNTGSIDLTAVDGTSVAADRFLTKNNKWATIPFGDITEVQGGTYIGVTDQTGPIPIINHNTTTRSDTASNSSPGSSGNFTAVDGVTTNTTGHITALNVKTITLPNTTYSLSTSPTGTAVRLSGNPSDNDVAISGTIGRTSTSRISASEIRVDLTPDVTIANDLTVIGEIDVLGSGSSSFAGAVDMTNHKILNVKTGTAGTDGVNLGQVELLVAGIGVFKGAYDASTNSPALEGSSNISLDQGDYFVVSFTGTFLGEALEPGNFIFANNAIAANSTPALSNYTVVIADDNVAGAGATDGAAQKGVSGFDSENFTVSTNGWVQLDKLSNPYGDSVVLTSGVTSGTETTFTVDVTTLFGAAAAAENCKTEVIRISDLETVYPVVDRNGTGSIAFKFSPSKADDLYKALISII
tara:strand:- start:1494 stop:2999 length:1506 start_codon:yes stop_codon:yes gene_type:complete